MRSYERMLEAAGRGSSADGSERGRPSSAKGRILACVIVSACLLAGSSLTSASAVAPSFRHLNPGAKADLRERVPVNFVFLGYDEGQVDTGEFLAGMPDRYRPLVRSRAFYGITDELGIDYRYDYRTFFTDEGYEDDFFGELTSLAVPADRTQFQDQYNAEDNNVLDVEDNHLIDAPSVERWLIENPPSGVDTTRNTIFFVNWFGRDDFKFHIYTKTGEPDPDTNHDFGELNQSRKIIAWGGTAPNDEETGYGGPAHRVWFYDLSAGPESWTDNWNVDDPDLDGNGVVDYRMPPVWEYTDGGFRSPSALSGDLSLVARYVGVDLLFTTSPLYPPDLTPPALPATVNADTNTYEGWQGTDASEAYITDELFLAETGELQPLINFTLDKQDLAFADKARRCYVGWLLDDLCYPPLDYPASANLFLYNALTKDVWKDSPEADYEAGLFNYATTDDFAAGLLGFADDNYRDGTQSFVFSFVAPFIVDLGYGLTTTMIHEYGHHAGMSHPHDGYDYETDTDFGPSDAFYFAWSGDESNSMMSYIDVNWDFSQFDRDNMNRFLAAEYVTNANAIAADILAAPDPGPAEDELRAADAAIGRAKTAFSRHEYLSSLTHAKQAYDLVLAGAAAAGVEVVGSEAGTTVDTTRNRERDATPGASVDRVGPNSHRARD